MSRLVTGLFYNRQEAEAALETLREAGIPSSNIYLEQEVDPTDEIGRKGGEVSQLERERRFAGLESGVIIGLAVGLISGLGMGIFAQAVMDSIRAQGNSPAQMGLPAVFMNPILTAAVATLLGGILGAIIGRIIDATLDRLGAGPARPMEETLVTIRAAEDQLQHVYATLFRARARHLHVSEQAI